MEWKMGEGINEMYRLRTFVATLLLLFSVLLSAQNWFPQGAEWYYAHSVNFCIGYLNSAVSGDTTINGEQYQIVSSQQACISGVNQQLQQSSYADYYVRADTSVVWIYVSHTGVEDTLYRMNAAPGEHWLLADMQESIFPIGQYCTVLDTFTTVYQGNLLHGLSVQYDLVGQNGTPYTYSDTIIERIGTLGGALLPMDQLYNFVFGTGIGGSLCSYDDVAINWGDSAICALLPLSIGSVNADKEAIVHCAPNPGSASVTVSLPEGVGRAVLNMYNQQGTAVHEQFLLPNTGRIHTEHLPSGMYLFRLRAENGREWTAKWVKR